MPRTRMRRCQSTLPESSIEHLLFAVYYRRLAWASSEGKLKTWSYWTDTSFHDRLKSQLDILDTPLPPPPRFETLHTRDYQS